VPICKYLSQNKLHAKDSTHIHKDPGIAGNSEVLQIVGASDEIYQSLKNVNGEHVNDAEGRIGEMFRNAATPRMQRQQRMKS
jgi:hypothetical protein